MIEQIPCLAKVPNKVIIHDAAANMKSAIPYMKQKSSTLLYADHLLNTSLSHACNDVPEVSACIKVATDLSSKIHRSTLCNQLLKKECADLEMPYVKIISPVATRWNSNYMLLESILKVKTALISLREKDPLNANLLQDVVIIGHVFKCVK